MHEDRKGAIIYWHRATGGTKVMQMDDPSAWISSLRRDNEFFEVFMLDGPVPSNRGC